MKKPTFSFAVILLSVSPTFAENLQIGDWKHTEGGTRTGGSDKQGAGVLNDIYPDGAHFVYAGTQAASVSVFSIHSGSVLDGGLTVGGGASTLSDSGLHGGGQVNTISR